MQTLRERFYSMSFPATNDGDWNITQGHADYCQTHGHATYTVDNIIQEWCPRCGETLPRKVARKLHSNVTHFRELAHNEH